MIFSFLVHLSFVQFSDFSWKKLFELSKFYSLTKKFPIQKLILSTLWNVMGINILCFLKYHLNISLNFEGSCRKSIYDFEKHFITLAFTWMFQKELISQRILYKYCWNKVHFKNYEDKHSMFLQKFINKKTLKKLL